MVRAWPINDESRLAEARQPARRPVEGTTVWCAGSDARKSASPGTRHPRETALSDARRREHWTADAGRSRAQQAGTLEARIVFGRGGTRVPAPQDGMRGVHCRAAGSQRGIVRRPATPAETRPNPTEQRAAQAPSSHTRLIESFAVHGVHPRKHRKSLTRADRHGNQGTPSD